MPSPFRPKGKAKYASNSGGGALDARQRELLEQQSQVQAKIDALQRTIAEAPTRAAEERRRSREAILASGRGQFTHGVSMVDTRHVEAAAAQRGPTRRRRPAVLRAERKADRLQTVALVVVVAVAVCWALSHYLL